jgi:hypothetical protein
VVIEKLSNVCSSLNGIEAHHSSNRDLKLTALVVLSLICSCKLHGSMTEMLMM